MRKVARKNLAMVGVMFTAAAALLLAAVAWSFLDSRCFFCPAIRQSRCLANLEAIHKAKEQLQRELQLAEGAALPAEELAARLPKGFRNLECPAGGTYETGPVGSPPRCSIPDHAPAGITSPEAARP